MAGSSPPQFSEIGRSALAKVSWRILPLIGLGYGVSYIDRVNISFAALQMNQQLHFSAAVYGLGAGLFFLSYAALEVPSNLLLVRFGARRWIARIMITWGLLAAGMMFVRSPMQFYVMRFLLGAAEAGFFPGVIYYLSQWFPAAHRGRAISRFYVAWPLSTVVMGLLAGSLLGLQGRMGLAGWQWLFLVEGLPAVLMSVIYLLWLPDRPETAAWLTADEKGWIGARLGEEAARHGTAQDHNIFRALLNPVVMSFALVNFLYLGPGYAFNLSAPTLLAGVTHMTAAKVGYLTAGAGLFGAFGMLFNGWRSDRRAERYLHLAIPLTLLAGAFALMSVTHVAAVFVGAYAAAMTCSAGVAAVVWLAPGEMIPPRSLAVSVAAINSVGQAGSFVFPWLWGIAKDRTGDFHLGLTILPFPFLVGAALVMAMRAYSRTRPKAGLVSVLVGGGG